MDLEDVRRAFEAHRMYGIGVQARMEWVDGVPRLHHGAWTEVLDIAWDRWLAATRAALRAVSAEAQRQATDALDSEAASPITLHRFGQWVDEALAALGGDE